MDKERKKWRRSILRRDRFKCKRCGKRKWLQAHHIKRYANFPSLRYDKANGITLCRYCHAQMKGNEEGFEELCKLLITKKSIVCEIGRMKRELEKDEQDNNAVYGD